MHEKNILNKNFLVQEELVKAIQANDDGVLESLYQENYYKTEKYIIDNSGSVEQAKDTFQEAFIAVWENVQNNKFIPKNETALNGYLYTVAKNKWLDFLKSSRFKKTNALDSHNYKIKSDGGDLDEQEENNISRLEKVTGYFYDLDQACKKLLTVFYYESKSLREIAAELNITEASARNKKYRCIEKLRALVITQK